MAPLGRASPITVKARRGEFRSLLTFAQIGIKSASSQLTEGRSREASSEWSGMWRLRARTDAVRALGAPRDPALRPLGAVREELAVTGRTRSGSGSAARGRRRSYGRAAKTPRWSAGRRCACVSRGSHPARGAKKRRLRLSALRPPHFEGNMKMPRARMRGARTSLAV
jgi:hypothetical protein